MRQLILLLSTLLFVSTSFADFQSVRDAERLSSVWKKQSSVDTNTRQSQKEFNIVYGGADIHSEGSASV